MIKPLSKNYLVRLVDDEAKKGNILLVNKTNEPVKLAEVMAIPNDNVHDLKIGDKVFVQWFTGHNIDDAGSMLIKQEHILGVLE